MQNKAFSNGIYIVATPIGNFDDITINALECLKVADYILCEDTRKTDILLRYHNIAGKKLLIYNEYTNHKDLDYFISLTQSSIVCVVSDAGTPLICDPGLTIVTKARIANIPIVVLPGACSLIAATTLCGINIQNCLFLGFFGDRTKILTPLEYTYVYFVAPHDIFNLLEDLSRFENDYGIILYIVKDVTKPYQEFLSFNLENALNYFNVKPKGEFVFFIKFMRRENKNIDDILNDILSKLAGWQSIGKKDFAKFLQSYPVLQTFTTKDIYNALLRIDI